MLLMLGLNATEWFLHLSAYATRMNIQLLKASDFNEKLRERGVPKEVIVQRICRTTKNEMEVREVLDEIWKNPERNEEILGRLLR